MKNHFFLVIVLSVLTIGFTSCDEDVDHTIDELVGTYIGAMNVTNPSFSNVYYSVQVTKVSGTKVRIDPSTGSATTWEVSIANVGDDIYSCTLSCLNDQITFTEQNDVWVLAYNFDSSNEQFSGLHQ